MARLNTQLSATPQQMRSSTVDSLYRDPSVASQNESNERTSSYSVLSPSRSMTSDKENQGPATRENTPRLEKDRGLRGASARMMTPDSGSAAGNGNKRRRTDNYNMPQSDVNEDGQDQDYGDGQEDEQDATTPSQMQPDAEEEGDLRFYNPNQNPNERQRLRARMRENQRQVDENRDEIIKPNNRLLNALKTQNSLFGKVRQTADAALDSRFLVHVSELASKKLNNSLQGGAAGIDFDQFVSKAVFFMKSGGGEREIPVREANGGEEEEGDEDPDGLDWAFLGRQAAFCGNRRPPTCSFLLGPLSVQKKARTMTQRKARSQRQPVGPATRPQEMQQSDLQSSESSNLSNLVKGIRSTLIQHLETGSNNVEEELSQIEGALDDEDQAAAFSRHRMAQTIEGEPAVSLLDFAINPRDFGQTVENLFYISFLVREGNAKIIKDKEGLPLLVPATPHTITKNAPTEFSESTGRAQKHQAVFSIDYPTWQMFIQAFNITQSLIQTRLGDGEQVNGNGWYTG
ncbi:Nse4-domain-containing protein [Clathrospora elynae]|uniref:Non-structural maintenance of chromosomes element 4 n=1 Tax=Clathrospora elynae TaxID=706981 RepID=A0A6A5S4K1_9PLEO|nr:Nse4-domain-containing protein [Clathrospora elynae]